MLTQLFELSWKDSNPHRRNQNPTCYHYTTRQLNMYVNQFLDEFSSFYQL